MLKIVQKTVLYKLYSTENILLKIKFRGEQLATFVHRQITGAVGWTGRAPLFLMRLLLHDAFVIKLHLFRSCYIPITHLTLLCEN
jgi:hypothetical protein